VGHHVALFVVKGSQNAVQHGTNQLFRQFLLLFLGQLNFDLRLWGDLWLFVFVIVLLLLLVLVLLFLITLKEILNKKQKYNFILYGVFP